MESKQKSSQHLEVATDAHVALDRQGDIKERDFMLSSHDITEDIESVSSPPNDVKNKMKMKCEPMDHFPSLVAKGKEELITCSSGEDGQIPQCEMQIGVEEGNIQPVEDKSNIIREDHSRFWYRLPKAAKASLILSLVGSILLIAYSITSVSLRNDDEEAHVATTIIILSIFTFIATIDAVLYENTLQLIASILLSFFMMLRVLWFISTRPTDSKFLPLKVIWGGLVCLIEILYMICALISCRMFGWRFYSRLGVDFRRPGARSIQRMAFVANLFNTLVKLDFVFLVVFCALGIDISVESRDTIDVPIFTISFCTFVVNLAISILALLITGSRAWRERTFLFNLLMPISYAGPIAIIVLYMVSSNDVANAATSTIIAGCVFMVVRSALWWTFHYVASDTHMVVVAGRATLKKDVVRADSWNKYEDNLSKDSLLVPLLEGAWLGKPTPRNPKKTRYFQLSYDGSTLRWGWNKYVRMYYVQDIEYLEENLSIKFTFLLDPEIVILFPDQRKFDTWRRGIDRLLVLLLSPEANHEHKFNDSPSYLELEEAQDSQERGIVSMLRKSFKNTFQDSPSMDRLRRERSSDSENEQLDRIKTPSKEQLKKRQKMASYLFAKQSEIARSPLSWILGKRPESAGFDHGPRLISVGTQTDPADFESLEPSEGSLIMTDEDKTADIAAQYAAMMNFGNFNGPMAPNSPLPSQGSLAASSSQGAAERIKGIRSDSLPPLTLERLATSLEIMESASTPGGIGTLAVSVEVIDFESISMGKLLGSGSEGDVHAAWYLESPVAVKRFNHLNDASYEAGMYLAIGLHDNVVSLRALCQHNSDVYLIMEYCPRGTLDSMLHYSAPAQWDPVKLLPLIRGICRAMLHLHSRNILHRDLKPANIFIGHGSTMKVGDFGMSCIVSSGQPSDDTKREDFVKNQDEILELVGSIQYSAPELINPSIRSSRDVSEWSRKLDVWSFGITLWEIMERKRPFEGLDELSIQSFWLNSPYQAHLPKIRLPEQGSTETLKLMRSLSDLIDDCTKIDPDARPTFQDILKRLRDLMPSK